MKTKSTITLSLTILFLIFTPLSLVHAANDPGSINEAITTITGNFGSSGILVGEDATFTTVAFRVINFLLSLAAIVALGVIIWGGFMYVGSLGDDQRITKAKRIIMFAIIGIIIIGASFAILNTVRTIFTPTEEAEEDVP